MEYIYGASVQGIQSFIFQTNKLKEIIGASQLVDDIFEMSFQQFCLEKSIPHNSLDIIMSAAGNIKLIAGRDSCEKIVKFFPMYVSNYAPGITISQAVEKFDKNTDNIQDKIDALEQKLKAQRNKPAMSIDIGFMGLERARRTGGVAYKPAGKNEIGFDDRGTYHKIYDTTKLNSDDLPKQRQSLNLFSKFSSYKEGYQVNGKDVPYDIEEITRQSDNGWLAIVHADGNGLGKLLQNLSKKITNPDKRRAAFTRFSQELEAATNAAAKAAFRSVIPLKWQEEIESQGNKERFPIRPVLLGGDDLTVIIRADLAYLFTKSYLESFEEKTKIHFAFMKEEYGIDGFQQGLTACAGIAYIKQSYPFHYGVQLAENLTSDTKKILKNLNNGHAPSALNLYKVQASFIDNLSEMKQRTHYAKASKVSFDYGPYLIFEKDQIEGLPHISDLDEGLIGLATLSEEEASGLAKLRQWSAELHRNKDKAEFMKNRMRQVNNDFYEKLRIKYILEPLEITTGEEKLRFIIESDEKKFNKNEEGKRYKFKSKVNDLIALSSLKSRYLK